MAEPPVQPDLRARAERCGILVDHRDAWGQPRTASAASLERIARVVGEPPAPRPLTPCQRAMRRGESPVLAVAHEGALSLRVWPLDGEPGARWEGRAVAERGSVELPPMADGVYGVEALGCTASFVHGPERALAMGRGWGLFAPVHALHDAARGHGDLAALGHLADRVEASGGAFTATLPLLPRVLEPGPRYDPSPYSPVSRLFWDELLVAAEHAPPVPPEAYVEPDAVWAAAWPGLVAEAQRHVAEASAWLAEDPERAAYAAHRSADAAGRLAFGWAQLRAHREMEALGARCRLLLDFPLGTRGARVGGFDTARHADRFFDGLSVGAPPDALFTGGQGWGFPPMDLVTAARDGFAYLRRCFAMPMRAARVLRIDHVAWLHRIYCIPDGLGPADGAYLQQPDWVTESLYAMLALLSHRHECALVGEDLGTVPREVRAAMDRWGLHRSWVWQLELGPEGTAPPEGALASMNTHDLPLFAAWWHGDDIATFGELGLLDAAGARAAHAQRRTEREELASRNGCRAADGPAAVLDAAIATMASTNTVMVAMEDLWLERRPQNVPGTSSAERPNWRGRAARPVEALADLAALGAPRVLSRER